VTTSGAGQRVTLSGFRELAGMTQAHLAEFMVTTQSAVARLESQDDVRLSTLARYVAAAGGRLHLVVEHPVGPVELVLPVLEPRPERTFRVIWQDAATRAFHDVGRLRDTGTDFEFSYTPAAQEHPHFEPFPAFPDLEVVYRSDSLFEFFTERTARAAGSARDLAAALGLSKRDAQPVELLARSWGTSPHDATIQVVPEPTVGPGGVESMSFLASGVRHVVSADPERAEAELARLRPRDELALLPEPSNAHNPKALLLVAGDVRVAYVPDYLTDYVHDALEAGRDVTVRVENANGPDTASHLRLLCQLEVGESTRS